MRADDAEAEAPWILWPLERLTATTFRPLREASVAEGFHFLERLELEWRTGENRFQKPDELLLGWWRFGQLAAIGGVNRVGDGRFRLRRFYVMPAWRRQGVGRMMLAFLIQQVAGRGGGQIELRTDTDGGAAFYESMGFSRVAETGVTHAMDCEPMDQRPPLGCTEQWTCHAGGPGEPQLVFICERIIDDPMRLSRSEWVELFCITTLARRRMGWLVESVESDLIWRVGDSGYRLESPAVANA